MFWHDLWDGRVLQQSFLELFSYSKNALISVSSMKSAALPISHFHLSLSAEAYDQFLQLQNIIHNIDLSAVPDRWQYIWGSFAFSSSKAYKTLIGSLQVHDVYGWLWRSSCQNKRKFFFWLLLKDRLSTRNLLKRKHMSLPDYNYVFCSYGIEESLHHLFFECSFAMACWNTL